MNHDVLRRYLILAVFTLLLVVGLVSIFTRYHALAWITIVAVDLYIVCVLHIAALQSDDENFVTRHAWVQNFFSGHNIALIVFTLQTFSIVFGFAGLYVGNKVFPSSKTPLDAFYISIFTLGFNNFSPTPGYGQWVVIAELISGILLIIGVFPMLISRISSFRLR